jgi:hypothetical protein
MRPARIKCGPSGVLQVHATSCLSSILYFRIKLRFHSVFFGSMILFNFTTGKCFCQCLLEEEN